MLETDPEAGATSLYWPIYSVLNKFTDPNVVKVVYAVNNRALYFSRSPIPATGVGIAKWYLGLYACCNHELQQLVKLPRSPLETQEALE